MQDASSTPSRRDAERGARDDGDASIDDTFAPFRGLLFRNGSEHRTAPPYDVLDDDEVARFRTMDEHNIVAVDLPVAVGDAGVGAIDSAPGTDAELRRQRSAHKHAATLLDSWVDTGVLAADAAPAFYLYRQGYHDASGRPRQTAGVVGGLALDAPDVLPHEHTTPKAKSDRLVSLEETRTNLSMIYGLSLAQDLASLLEPEGPPRAAVTDEDGVHHRLWSITSPAKLAAIRRIVGSAPVVIADGHHRYEVARRFHRSPTGSATRGADRIMTFVVPLDPEYLVVRPIHRVIPRLAVDPPELERRLRGVADITVAAPASLDPAALPDVVKVLTREALYSLTPLPATWKDAALAAVPPVVRHLAVTWTHVILLPALGVSEVVFHHDPATVASRVVSGSADAGILLPPVDVQTISRVADARERMPPKTTFFWPKARTGLVLRRFADQDPSDPAGPAGPATTDHPDQDKKRSPGAQP